MRIFRDNTEYQGTPDEIAYFFNLQEEHVTAAYPSSDFEPFESIVNDSEQLRKKLAADPSYNPFGGVVPPKDTDTQPIVPSADLDTGVTFSD